MISTAWWTVLFPALAIASLVIAVNLVADGITHWSSVSATSTDRAAPRRPPRSSSRLDVAYRVRGADRQVLRGVTLRIERGESVRAGRRVGLRQVDRRARDRPLPAAQRPGAAGSVLRSTAATSAGLSGRELRELRASAVSMVYQNPGAALNPSIRVGRQVAEVFTVRGVGARRGARARDRDAPARCRSPTPTR